MSWCKTKDTDNNNWQATTIERPYWLSGHPFSAANFAKFHGTICEIPRPVGAVVLTDSTSKYKEFIVTCNTKMHYIRSLMMKIHFITLIIIINVSLQQLDFIVL